MQHMLISSAIRETEWIMDTKWYTSVWYPKLFVIVCIIVEIVQCSPLSFQEIRTILLSYTTDQRPSPPCSFFIFPPPIISRSICCCHPVIVFSSFLSMLFRSYRLVRLSLFCRVSAPLCTLLAVPIAWGYSSRAPANSLFSARRALETSHILRGGASSGRNVLGEEHPRGGAREEGEEHCHKRDCVCD